MIEREYLCVGTGVNKQGEVYSTLALHSVGKDKEGVPYDYINFTKKEYISDKLVVGHFYKMQSSLSAGGVATSGK